MQVTDQDTGKKYFLDNTPELKTDLEALAKTYCNHDSVEIRQRKDGGGASHYYRQCIHCGKSVGSALKKTVELENSPPWIAELEEQFNSAFEAKRRAVYQKHVRKQRDGEEGFRRKYDIYLQSSEWKQRRAKVLRRANHICEGCLDHKATQVHHLTYKHIFDEFLFELVALCDDCHARIHPEKKNHQDEEADFDFDAEWRDGHPCEGCRFGMDKDGRRWCFVLDQLAAKALAPGGDCGPEHSSFEPLK